MNSIKTKTSLKAAVATTTPTKEQKRSQTIHHRTFWLLFNVIVNLCWSLLSLGTTILSNIIYYLTTLLILTLLTIIFMIKRFAKKMCLIETYLQMAQIDAQIKQTNGTVDILDDNNNTKESDIQDIADRIGQQNLNDMVTCNKTSSELSAQQAPGTTSESFAQLFKMFAKFGDSKSTGEAITLSNSDKWFKQARIIDPTNKTITTTDTGIYFKQVAKTKKALTLKEYNLFLEKLASVKKTDLNELKNKLQNSGSPSTNKTTTAVTSGAIGRLTDHTKYTGSHKQRFDESGKGRGKAGREDIPGDTGYILGFKATN